jgi:F-type H+-transporting ATPase subunit gamma
VTYLTKFKEISKAIQLVAISKLRNFRDRIESREMALHLVVVMFSISETHANEAYTVVVLTTDRNCCGALNSSVLYVAKEAIEAYLNDHIVVKIIAVGLKGYISLATKYVENIRKKVTDLGSSSLFLSYALTLCIFDTKFDKCAIYFSKYYRVFEQFASVYEIKSYSIFLDDALAYRNQEIFFDVLLTSSVDIRALYYYNMCLVVLDALEDTKYSEFGSRAYAMEMAHRNANTLLKEQILRYNRARQEGITNDLLDIVSGAIYTN